MNKTHRISIWVLPLLIAVITSILFIIPMLVIKIPEDIYGNWVVYFSLDGFIFLSCAIKFIELFIGERKENKLIAGAVSSYKTKGEFLYYKTKISSTNIFKYYQVKYSYQDQNGVNRRRVSFKTYSTKEIEYLESLGSFEILVNGKNAAIVEDLNETKIDMYFQNLSNNRFKNKTAVSVDTSTHQHKKPELPISANNKIIVFVVFANLVFCLGIVALGVYSLFTKEFVGGIATILFGSMAIYLISKFFLSTIIFNKKAQSKKAVLLNIEEKSIGQQTTRFIAVVNFENVNHKVNIIKPSWAHFLKDYIDKEIPIKVWKNKISIDYESFYSNNF